MFDPGNLPVHDNKNHASAGNRTRINCLEGSYADHYTTDASLTGTVGLTVSSQLIYVSVSLDNHGPDRCAYAHHHHHNMLYLAPASI